MARRHDPPGGSGLPGRRPHAVQAARLPFGTGRLIPADLGVLSLEDGSSLPVTLAYRHDGPGPDAPQVLVIHALTGSADAAGDWWEPLIGPGRALDTDRVGVLCANLLGGRYGSTGPETIDPRRAPGTARRSPNPPHATRRPRCGRSPMRSGSSGSRSSPAGRWAG